MLGEVQAETLSDRLTQVKPKGLVDALANTLGEEAALTQEKTLGDMEAKTLVDALPDRPGD